jgi:hypothetical protein
MAGPKYAPDAMIDSALTYVAGATVMHVCSVLGAVPTRAQVLTASLANVAVTGVDFANADGTSGRKVTVAAKNAVAVTASGNAENVVLIDGTNVRYMTSCTTQAVVLGNTVNVPTWVIQIADPT